VKTHCGLETDAVCQNCTQCPEGQYGSSPCTMVADRICSDCSSCELGATFNAGGCNSTTDTICQECRECPEGYVKTGDCTLDEDTQCEECRPCDDNTFSVDGCKPTGISSCDLCASSCSPGQFVTEPCTPTSDITCEICPADHYCPHGSPEPTPCPDYSSSELGSTSESNCRCKFGFETLQ
jgi:hypothetical protein